jgi:hypothetical protein
MPNFVTTSLPKYVQENKDMLLKNFALVGGSTRSRISVQTGIKSTARINFMEIAPVLQDGNGCGFNAQGAVSLSQRDIDTAVIKVNLDICPETLRGKYAEYLIKTNATAETLPFEQFIMEGITNVLTKKNEMLMWQGDKASGNADLKWINGFIKVAGAEADVKDVTIDADKIYDAILAVYMELPDEVIERGAEIYVSPANFRKFMQELVAKNFFHYAGATEAAPEEFYFPGTNAKVVLTPGLTGVNDKILGTFAKNLFYGCDMEGDAEDIKVWFSDDDDLYKLKVKWNMGVQIAFPDMVVLGATA